MMKISKEIKTQFVEQVKKLSTLNLPLVARTLELDWTTDVKPMLETDESFRSLLQEAFDEIRYELIDGVYKVARDGKPKAGSVVEVSYVKEVIKYMDSGALFGKVNINDDANLPDEKLLQRHLERLNINESD